MTPAVPISSSPYAVIRYTPTRGKIHLIESIFPKSSPKCRIPDDLASGDIITMCAALHEHGFSKADQNRWFLVLGKLATRAMYVIAPLATFGGLGKKGLDDWKGDYFKPVHRFVNYDQGYQDDNEPDEDEGFQDEDRPNDDEEYNNDYQWELDEGYSSDDDKPTNYVWDPKRPVYSDGYLCCTGSVVSLATAFIVEPDRDGRIPATFGGCLIAGSFEDVWQCIQHLGEHHSETSYLLETNMIDWDIDVATSMSSCDTKACRLGETLKKRAN